MADSVTSISSSGLNANVDECVINQNSTKQEDIFKLGNCSVDGLIGKSVVFYYEIERSSQNKVLKYIAEQTNNVSIKINVEDLIGFPDLDPFNGGKIEYWENSNTSYERKTTLTVAPSPTFVLNGKIYTPTSRADFKRDGKPYFR